MGQSVGVSSLPYRTITKHYHSSAAHHHMHCILSLQGTFVMGMLYCKNGSHYYKTYFSDAMDVWTSETLKNPAAGEPMQVARSQSCQAATARRLE